MVRRKPKQRSAGRSEASAAAQRGGIDRWLPVVLVVAAAVGVYANSVNNEFLYDDDHIVKDDPRTRDPAHWRETFTRGYWYRRSVDPIYRPVPLLTYLANHVVHGFQPAGYRLVNIALHAGVSLAVYAIGLQLFRRRWTAVGAGVLFAVHPIHAEVVVIIVGRADLLCALLYLLAVWQLLREPMTVPSRFSARFARVLILFAVALLSKENAITFVGAAVLVDLWRRWQAAGQAGVASWRSFWVDRLVRRYLPLVTVAGLALLVRYQAMGRLTRPQGIIGGGIDNPLDAANLVGRLLTPFVLLGKYLNMLIWPHPLSYDYSYNAIPIATGLGDSRVLIGVAWAVLLVVAALVSWRRRKRVLWCVGFFVVTYSVAGNAIVLIGTLFAERLVYLASVAWCWAVAMAVAAAFDRIEATRSSGRIVRAVVAVAVVAGLVGYAARTVARNGGALRNNKSLYLEGFRVNPGSAACQSASARICAYRGDHQGAIERFRTALSIDDTAWYDHMLIGQEYALVGKVELGLKHLHRSYDLCMGQFRFDPAFLLGQVYLRTDRPAEALGWLRTALALKPSHALCTANLGYALAAVDPPQRDRVKGTALVEQALTATPNDPAVLELAWATYRVCGRGDRAAVIARRALQIVPKTHASYRMWQDRMRAEAKGFQDRSSIDPGNAP